MENDLMMTGDLKVIIIQSEWPEDCFMKEVYDLDYERLYQFETEHFKDAPNFERTDKDLWITELKNWMKTDSSVKWFLAYHQNELIGSLSAWKSRDRERTYHIQALLVAREWRKKGIATSMLADFFLYLKKLRYQAVTLKVHKDNTAAIRLYQKIGMTITEG